MAIIGMAKKKRPRP